jgi:hypothetical protein
MRISTLLLMALLLAAPFAEAADREASAGKVIDNPVTIDDPANFGAENEWITHEMNPGGRYEFIKPEDKQRVATLLGQMGNILADSGSVEAMDRDAHSQLLTAQDEVNGILKHNDSNRLVCESLAPTGSHIPVKTCHTYAQAARSMRTLQSGMDNSSRRCGRGASQYSSRYASPSMCGGP